MLLCSGLGCDKRHGDGKTARFEIFCRDGSFAGLYAGLYDGKSQSHAPALAVPHRLRPVKRLKQAADGRFRHTGALVAYRDKNRIARLFRRDFDGPLITRIEDGVSHDV